MIAISLTQIADLVSGTIVASQPQDTERVVSDITIDSRNVKQGSLFVALKGERFDGHIFVAEAIGSGAVALLVSQSLAINIPQVVVADTRIALGLIAAWIRNQSTAKVVALTGSSGKTSVKEMTAVILSLLGNVLYTKGNFNNDIGVPLTLSRLTSEHQYAVIELGANHISEIAYTVQLTNPDSALINNIAEAHLEGFGSLAGVIEAKGEIFNHLAKAGTAIINAESHGFDKWQSKLPSQTVWRFSSKEDQDAEFYATAIKLAPNRTTFQLHSPQGQIDVELGLIGQHNIANALAAAALAMSVGATLPQIKQGLLQCKPVRGRLFPIELADGKVVLDDSYNANIGSMTAAANVLSIMPGYKIMVVGDMGELGEESDRCHLQVGDAIRDAGVDCVLSVGRLSHLISQQIDYGEHFPDKSTLVIRLKTLLSQHKTVTVLIKGSRSAAMEEIAHELQENSTC